MLSRVSLEFFSNAESDLKLAIEHSQETFLFIPSNSNLCITSVHGYSHIRQNAVKPADSGSILFSYCLAKLLNASWVGVIKEESLDNNFYENTPLKKFIDTTPKFADIFIDIHTCNAYRPFDIELGTALNTADIRPELQLQQFLSDAGYLTIINQIFCAKGATDFAQTMTMFWQQKQLRAFQIELASSFLVSETRHDVHLRSKLLYQLAQGILNYEKAWLALNKDL